MTLRLAPTRTSQTAMSFALLAGVAFGQNPTTTSDQKTPLEKRYGITVREAIAEVKSGECVAVHLTLLDQAKAVEAIPDLERLFTHVEQKNRDPHEVELDKLKIAEVLVKLGDKDDTYWDYLVRQVTPVIESDAPPVASFDSAGKMIPKSAPSPAFTAWAKAHQLDPGEEAADAIYVYPGRVMSLSMTQDSRAIPLLRRALLSPNYMVEIEAAMGLAANRDETSIPTIIEACRRAPADVAAAIARFSLVYFDDSRAQTAVDEYLPKDQAKAYREERAKGRTPWN